MATVIAIGLDKFVIQSLHLKSSNSDISVYLWTFSKIALHWIYMMSNIYLHHNYLLQIAE